MLRQQEPPNVQSWEYADLDVESDYFMKGNSIHHGIPSHIEITYHSIWK
jgi:hypothetical protein